MYLESASGTNAFSSAWTTRVGAAIAGSSARASAAAAASWNFRIAPGLLIRRWNFANHARRRSSPARLGNSRSKVRPVPQPSWKRDIVSRNRSGDIPIG